jgi:glycerol-3-phosphate dehydrogenase
VTRARARGLELDGSGRVIGLEVEDRLLEGTVCVAARAVIDATGVWAAATDGPLGGSGVSVVPSRGSHVLVARERLPIRTGLTVRVPGKVLFVVPWPGAWIVGTTDEPDSGPPDRPAPTAHEVRFILDMLNGVLEVDLRADELIGAYAGLRPLIGIPGGDTVRISREHKVHRERSGLVRISGGKYTTYRVMARDAVDVALGSDGERPPSSGTADLTLVGATDRPSLERLAARLGTEYRIGGALATALVERHGTEAEAVLRLGVALDLLRPLGAGVPHLEAEVSWAVRHELALSVDDVLARRMRLAMLLPDRAATIAPRVAELMARDLGWDQARRDAEVSRYLSEAHRQYDIPTDGAGSVGGSAGPDSSEAAARARGGVSARGAP